jgi:prophage regulatory protein
MRQIERSKQVRARVGNISLSTLYRWIDAGQFPKPFRLQDRTIAWDAEQIDRWLDQRQTMIRQPT